MTATVTDSKTLPPAEESEGITLARHWRTPLGLGAAAILAFLVFGLGTAGGQSTNFAISRATDFVKFDSFQVPSRGLAIGGAIVALLLAGVSAYFASQVKRNPWWLPTAYAVAIMLSLLAWAGAGKGTLIQVTGLLTGAVVLSVPLVFGALSGVICERVGVINIAIEGQLLCGAFLAAVLASATGNPYVGLIFAPLAGALVGALLALFAVKYWVDQIVVGVVLNVLVIGLTNFLYGTLLTDNPSLNQSLGLPRLPIPLLSQIPIVGPVLFNHNLLVYLMYIVVITLNIMLFKSRWGLRLRSVGEHPKAADTVGIKVNRTRVRNTILGGAVAGLGGAFFTVAAGLAFGKEMTSGKGFIALAAMILGRWSPKGALAAALFFGFAESLKDQLGIIGSSVPSQFLAMLPYLATIFAVAGLVGHVRPPAAEGKPYKK